MSDTELLDKGCDAAVIRDLAAGISEVNTAGEGGKPFSVVPANYKLVDLEYTLPRPLALRAEPNLDTLAGFIAYIVAFKGNDTAIFVDGNDGAAQAVLDYHGRPDAKDQPSWCHHRARYTPEHTVEWLRWKEKDDKWMDQRAFAEFIENNVDDIVQPNGAQMLDIASTLEAKTGVEFKSGVRLDNGSQKLTFNTEVTAKAGTAGDVTIPNIIELAIAPFRGGDAYPLKARFRYKVDGSKLQLRYQLVNPHKIIEAAVANMVKTIATGTAITPFIGTP